MSKDNLVFEVHVIVKCEGNIVLCNGDITIPPSVTKHQNSSEECFRLAIGSIGRNAETDNGIIELMREKIAKFFLKNWASEQEPEAKVEDNDGV